MLSMKGEKKTIQITIRLEVAMHTELLALAKAADRDKADYVRLLIKKNIEDENGKTKKPTK
ncbi:MAG: hypothetical protein JNK91_08900 [Ferruginibacter sp.]|nr:hypothetical protein [Ferruginibacter sp.]